MALKRTASLLLAAGAVGLTACGDDPEPTAALHHTVSSVRLHGEPAVTVDATFDPASSAYRIVYTRRGARLAEFRGRPGEQESFVTGDVARYPIRSIGRDGVPTLDAGRRTVTVRSLRDEQVPRTPALVQGLAGR